MKFKYGTFELEGRSNIVFVRRKLDEDEESRPHYHDAIELNIVLSGELGCVVDGEKYTATKGQMFCFYNMETHYFVGREGSEIMCVIINEKMLNDFIEGYRNSFGVPCLPILMADEKKNQEAIDFLCEWEKIFSNQDWLGNKGRANIFFSMLKSKYDLRYIKRNKYKIYATDVLKYLNSNYKEEITLQSIADEFGYSRVSVSRIFHKFCGQDIRSYLNLLRVEKVSQMMEKDPRKSVSECAFECGFKNMNSFYRAYKERFNTLPKQKNNERGEKDV